MKLQSTMTLVIPTKEESQRVPLGTVKNNSYRLPNAVSEMPRASA